MKKSTTEVPQNGGSKNNRALNKDKIDARKNEEQDFKGTDITHNEKETKAAHLKKKHE